MQGGLKALAMPVFFSEIVAGLVMGLVLTTDAIAVGLILMAGLPTEAQSADSPSTDRAAKPPRANAEAGTPGFLARLLNKTSKVKEAQAYSTNPCKVTHFTGHFTGASLMRGLLNKQPPKTVMSILLSRATKEIAGSLTGA
jgi:hypothetical protein